MFSKRQSVEQIEESREFCPKFNDGLIPVVTTDIHSGELLMHGYMNAEALQKTIELKEAVYYSRSRKTLWHKGKTSGFIQKVIEMRVDDDQDCIWLKVDTAGKGSCHVGYRSCFYRSVNLNFGFPDKALEFLEKEKIFDPQKVYGDISNPTVI